MHLTSSLTAAIMQLRSSSRTAKDKNREEDAVSSDETRESIRYCYGGIFDDNGCVIRGVWEDSKEENDKEIDEKIKKDRVLENTTSLSQNSMKDYCQMDGTMLEDSNRKNEVERSGFSFYSLGRKSWVHFLMVLVLIFVQSTDNFALGKEIKVDEEGSLVDLTVQNQGRNLVKCEDVKGKFYISSTDQTKGCGWVQYKTVFRCELEEVKENCRKTCGLCDEINSESPPYDSQDPDISYGTQRTSSPSKNIQGNPLAPGPSKKGGPGKGKGKISSPTTEPSTCRDEPNWKYSVLDPELSNFKHLIGKTCDELESQVPPELHDEFCQGIALNTGQSKCVLEGCCFCGGGTLREVTCVDIGNWYASETINCDFISKMKALDEKKAEDFCESWKEFYSDDMIPSEACCACEGGKHVNSLNGVSQGQERRLDEDEEEEGGLSTGGVPNLEFLGIGYDAIRGNPRGSSNSELDPGFRYRVFNFQQSSANTTLDGAYFVPRGTEFRYTSSCHYDSISTEISSEEDYRESLSKESSFSNTLSVSAQGQYGIVAGKLETTVSWSESESYSSFREKSVSENTVTFEAKAICSEFEVSFNPYSEKNLDPHFKRALTKISSLHPFDPQSVEHKREYRAFINAYGTHYTKKVILGAKRVLSTTMTSRDVAELTKDQVDISSTLSVDVQLAIGTAEYVKDSLGGSFPDPPEEPKDPSAPDYLVHVIQKDASTPTPPESEATVPKKGASGLGASVSNKYDKFTSTSKQTESAFKISQKKIKTKELNFGGLPNVDWREWAASVKDRPMPIMYENAGLWTLFEDEKAREAFLAALYHLEGFKERSEEVQDYFIDIAHFGVATGSGDPLSESSVNPNASYRAIFQVNELESSDPTTTPKFNFKEDKDKQKAVIKTLNEDYEGKKDWTSWATPLRSKQYMCGAKVDYDQNNSGDDEGILNIYFNFCEYGDWEKQSGYVRAGNDLTEDNEDSGSKGKKCSTGKFVRKIHVRECLKDDACENSGGDVDDFLGIYSLMIECCSPDDCDNTIEYKQVHCLDDVMESGNKECNEDNPDPKTYDFSVGPIDVDDSQTKVAINLISAGRVLEGNTQSENRENENGDGTEDVAVINIKIQWEEVQLLNPSAGGGAFSNIATYATVWKGKIDRPTPIFANAIRGAVVQNEVEESEEYGFISYVKNKWTCDMGNNIMFGLSGDKIAEDGAKSMSYGVFATTNFGRQIEISRLHSFSFATFENDPNILDSIVSGVIRYDGVTVNSHGGRNLGFEVSQKVESAYDIAFKEENMKAVKPIVLLFPEWYLDSQIYPSNAGQVSVALIGGPQVGKFRVMVGDKEFLDRSYLGFNFVAIDPSIVDIDPSVVDESILAKKTKNYSLGTSSSPTTSKDRVEKFDGSVPPEKKGNMEGALKYTRITFKSPFKTLPTLIVTPIIDTTSTIDNDNIPRCIIETLTKEMAVVKCDILKKRDDDGCKVTPIEFNYLAIGEREF